MKKIIGLGLGIWMLLLLGAGAQEKVKPPQEGQETYVANCADCHRTNGEGLPNVFPSLAKNAFVTGDPNPVIKLVLEGRKARIGHMPSWKDTLSDQHIAGVITFIRQSWGNQAEAVTPDMVAKNRKK